MHAIILAAGRGGRLMPLTRSTPKCLVKVGKKPILFYILRALKINEVNSLTIVIGYRGNQIKDYIRTNFPEFKVNFVINPQFKVTNDIYSLFLARKFFKKNSFILDSDILFHPKIISELIKSIRYNGVLAMRRGKCGKEEMKILSNKKGAIQRISKKIDPRRVSGEFMGISLFSKNFLQKLIPALKETLAGKLGEKLDREVAYEKIMKRNKIYAVDITGFPAIEIDFKKDVKRAEKEILPKLNYEYF